MKMSVIKLKILAKQHFIFICILLLALVLLLTKLGSVPPLWFDEGWALSLARNWVELGHYGHLLDGQPVPSTILNTGFPAISLIALSFKYLGVGLWQARLPGSLVVLIALVLFYVVTLRLYDRAVATVAVASSILLPAHIDLVSIILGRQALGEMPAVLFMLCGYIMLLLFWHRPWISILLPSFFWSLALQTKPQVMPFLFISYMLPIVLSIISKNRTTARKLILSLFSTITIFTLLTMYWNNYMLNHSLSLAASSDPYAMVRNLSNILIYVLVFDIKIRLDLLISPAGMVPIIGVIWYAVRLVRSKSLFNFNHRNDVIQLMLLGFTASWLFWFLFLSIGWPRYAFPGVFFANVYAAKLICTTFSNLRLTDMLEKDIKILKSRRFPTQGLTVTLFSALLLYSLYNTCSAVVTSYRNANSSIIDVSHFLNRYVAQSEVIETYESELFFLLDKRYHFPPDSVQHQLNRRVFFGQDVEISYDPLQMYPEYIVVGWANYRWHLYDAVIVSDPYHLVFEKGIYQVYQKAQ